MILHKDFLISAEVNGKHLLVEWVREVSRMNVDISDIDMNNPIKPGDSVSIDGSERYVLSVRVNGGCLEALLTGI